MIILSKYKVSFPQLGNYYIPIKILFTEGLEVEYIVPPVITKRTLELGSRYSPDSACAPFKYILGNYIETLELGANTLVQTGGVCRLGYYGELHDQILKDLGYDVTFVNFAKTRISKPATFYEKFKQINPDVSLSKIANILPVILKMVEYIDEIEDYMRQNIGFEVESGSFNRIHDNFLGELGYVRTKKELNYTYKKYLKLFKGIKLDKPKKPLRVGLVGEYYTIMEPFSNHFMEKELAQKGIVVDRWMNITNSLLHPPEKKRAYKKLCKI